MSKMKYICYFSIRLIAAVVISLGLFLDSALEPIICLVQGVVITALIACCFSEKERTVKSIIICETICFIISALTCGIVSYLCYLYTDIYMTQLYVLAAILLVSFIAGITICLIQRKIVTKGRIAALSALATIIVISDIVSLSTAEIYPKNEKWNSARNLYQITIHDPTITDNESQYNAGQRFKSFVSLSDDTDGIMMYPSDYYRDPEMYDEIVGDSIVFYDPSNRGVYINNNYLRKNPIYDVNSNAVDVDNNDVGMTVLLPKKYSEYYDDIYQYYLDWYRWSYYIDEMVHQEYITGEPFNIEDKDYLPVKIITVKDNQTYFTYSRDIGDDDNNITDPIAFVINGVNMGGDTYLAAVSNGYYYVNGRKNVDVIGQQTDTLYQIGEVIPIYSFDEAFITHIAFLGAVIIIAGLCVLINIKEFRDCRTDKLGQ